MERYCFVMAIAPGTEQEYERRHDEIWPDLVRTLQDAGVTNYTLFRSGTQVVGYAECVPDASTAWTNVASSDANDRWQEWFADIIVSRSDGGTDLPFREIWHLD